jgi:CheY-like chemotaxis protein
VKNIESKRDRGRALIVDDDEAIRYMLVRILDREGFDTDVAGDGFEAIEKLASDDYDVVLLDLMMPRVDGFGVIRHLKLQRPEALSHVIVMTAMTSPQIDPEVGCVMRKPFDVQRLASLARQLSEHGVGGDAARAC